MTIKNCKELDEKIVKLVEEVQMRDIRYKDIRIEFSKLIKETTFLPLDEAHDTVLSLIEELIEEAESALEEVQESLEEEDEDFYDFEELDSLEGEYLSDIDFLEDLYTTVGELEFDE